jgi:hypothetical protein
VKSTPELVGTVQRWVHEMAETYSAGAGEIADKCEDNAPVRVDGVSVPQYWSVANNSCWPLSDLMEKAGTTVARAGTTRAGVAVAAASPMTSVARAEGDPAPHIGGGP